MWDTPVSDLLRIMHSDNFNVHIFKITFKHVNDCKNILQCSEEKVVIEHGFQNCTLRKVIGPFTGLAVHYKWDSIKVYKNGLALRGPKPISCSIQHMVCLYSAPGKTMPWIDHISTLSTTQWNRTSWKLTTKTCPVLMKMTVHHLLLSTLLM